MGKLSDQESELLEEHLLVCVRCQNQLEEADEFLPVAKTALATLDSPPPSHKLRLVPGRTEFSKIPPVLWAAGLAALILIALAPLFPGPAAGVTLSTTRSAASFPQLRAGQRPLLRIDVTQTPQLGGCQLEIVDPAGQPLWHAAVEARDRQIVTGVPKRLARGRYWIRLYDTGSPWTLLREYGLDVQ